MALRARTNKTAGPIVARPRPAKLVTKPITKSDDEWMDSVELAAALPTRSALVRSEFTVIMNPVAKSAIPPTARAERASARGCPLFFGDDFVGIPCPPWPAYQATQAHYAFPAVRAPASRFAFLGAGRCDYASVRMFASRASMTFSDEM